MLCSAQLGYVRRCCVMLYYGVRSRTELCLLRCNTSCYIVLRCVMRCVMRFVPLCSVVLRYVTLYCVMIRYVYVMLCYVVSSFLI